MSDTARWQRYYDQTEQRPPRDVLVAAAERFAKPDRAIDLGCGAGRDTLALLAWGWRVLAVDAQPDALVRLQKLVPLEHQPHLTTQKSHFESLPPLPAAMLINASYCLPFCHPDSFSTLWQKICAALLPNGRFVGTFFGLDDDWADRPNQTHLAEADVKALFTDFNIEHWHEQNELGSTASGQQKHWHVFTVIAQKR